MDSSISAWTHQFICTNRINLHYVTQGEGELVILLHGFPEFWYSWRFQIPVLAKHFKVVVPDLRGYNDSDKPRSGYDIDTLTQDILGLIESLGYTQAHVVGHDCGGMIAWNLAHRFPQSLKSLSLLNAPHPSRLVRNVAGTLDDLLRTSLLFAAQVPGIPEQWIHQSLPQFVRNYFQTQAVRKAAFSKDVLELYEAALAKQGAVTAVLHHYRQMLNPSLWLAKLGGPPDPIQVPTLVLWGEDDTTLDNSLLEVSARFIQAPFRAKLIPECGHWIQQEVPRLVNAELLKFLPSAPALA
ncbi:alpha/beta fold hydrolase [Lyngbya confervoides]|uniref:Alpha/beta hydrolase n=1 Tax=Lyngbya confervoides BDU141951 TaxID=1574623 RepID=A0ABD4T4M5_9CYAN|nr:alpha/beta hydrolase [Lyngbya confervoides]MCM1983549.1 alpha/beta hydrolase [Lyngbya confervoides BDU141951]